MIQKETVAKEIIEQLQVPEIKEIVDELNEYLSSWNETVILWE